MVTRKSNKGRNSRKKSKIGINIEKDEKGIKYDADYFERGIQTGKSLYENYQWLPHLTIPFAMRVIDFLGIKRGDTILDIGCAKGYLVKAFRWLGRKAYGYDISEYAIKNVDPEVKRYVTKKI